MSDKPRVLIAEDEDDIRMISQAVLMGKGYDVIPAEDGQKAWEIYQEQGQNLSVLLTDIRMPRMDGLELIRKIRENDSELPIVAYTATHEDEAREAGANYVLPKPFSNINLADTIGKAVRRE